MAKLDITKPVKEILIDKFNANAGLQIGYNDVELGDMTALATPTANADTTIELVPTLTASFLNKFHLNYKKMDVSDIFGAPYLFIKSNSYSTLYELLDELNVAVGVNLTTDDVDDATITYDTVNTPANQPTVVINIKDTSVLYKGNVTIKLDITLNGDLTSVNSNTTIYAVHRTASLDYVSAHAFNGVRANAFTFFNNIDLVSYCKIDRIFSTESSTIVLIGTFQLVATNLVFITVGSTYNTITMDRTGKVLSARSNLQALQLVNQNNIFVDTINDCYYITDVDSKLTANPKLVYRLFENGTMDNNFNYNLLDSKIVRFISSTKGFYTISLADPANNIYQIKRYSNNSILDDSFQTVNFTSNNGAYTTLSGFSYLNESGDEELNIIAYNGNATAAKASTYATSNVSTEVSATGTDYYSPVFTVKDNGSTVIASNSSAQINNPAVLDSNSWYPRIFKVVNGNYSIYCLNSFGYLKNKTITPIVADDDHAFELVSNDFNLQWLSIVTNPVIELTKVIQISTGYETYALARYTDAVTNKNGSEIISFDIDHKVNGIIVLATDETVDLITDLTALTR